MLTFEYVRSHSGSLSGFLIFFGCILIGGKCIVITYVPYVTNVDNTVHATYTQPSGTEKLKYVSHKEYSPPYNF